MVPAPPSVVPAPAVSVVLLRDVDGGRGMEVFVQHRALTMDFVPGAVVFPGGRVDARDVAEAARVACPEGLITEHVWAWRATAYGRGRVTVGRDPREAASILLATAIRELAEETGLEVTADELIPWDNWITPASMPKRFDVAFFALSLAATTGRIARHQTTEARHSEWLPVAEVLRGNEIGDLVLVPPTRVILEELAILGSVETVLTARPRILPVDDAHPDARPRVADDPSPP